ncbi:ABC transporter ATP-binding protein [Maricaulis parjimensis]|uniref:ABC transporter ATP-binding protein n=1 Tax=Maricaulis parjimensis TaxID=144023 RepID=UPI00193A2FFF|nr:ABC transporter ATP-binding protein [Maricaulis parjimensis]
MTTLSLQDLRFGYGERRLIDGLDLDFPAAGLTALVGPNGAGKSTCLKLAAGLLEPATGHVSLDGVHLSTLSPRERARRIGYLPPDGRSAWPMTVEAVVALGRVPWRKPLRQLSPEDQTAIEAAMEQTGVAALADRRVDSLSSGEQARVLIARTLAGEGDVLVLDEPTAALDIHHQLVVMDMLKQAATSGRHVLLAVHALDLAARYADRVIVLANGKVRADGPPGQALSEAVVSEVFGIRAPGGIQPTPLRELAPD